jgi:hypothetical protein
MKKGTADLRDHFFSVQKNENEILPKKSIAVVHAFAGSTIKGALPN